MPGEQSVHSDEASNLRKILEKSSPNSTFSLRSELLSDQDSHKAHRSKTHRSSSHRRHRSHRDRDRDRGADGTVLATRQLSRLLVHEELDAAKTRQVLFDTADRLEQESRRANDAELRAREAEARALALQATKQAAQAEALREQEKLKAYQAQLEVARNEIHRAQKELDTMAADRERAEEEAAKERSKARAMAKEVEIQRALEQGRREGKNQGYVDGRKDGWYLGTRDGRQEALKEIMYYDDVGSVTSHGSITPPRNSSGQPPPASMRSMATTTRSTAPPPATVNSPTPTHDAQSMSQATAARAAAPQTSHQRSGSFTQTSHKRSGSFTQSIKARLRGNSDPRPSSGPVPDTPKAPPAPPRTATTPEHLAHPARPGRLTPSNSHERLSPIPVYNPPPSPRHTPTSPLPGGYIPLQENGRVSLPPPHELDPPPPSPHSPAIPLPDLNNGMPGQSLQPPNYQANVAPTITVQEPTPPEPARISMPEAHPAPPPPRAVAENNMRPSKVHAILTRPESPPLPPIPGPERPNKGKQRQRGGPPRAGTGLHAPGRSSPSDTSTEFSQFDIVEQPERVRGAGLVRNGSQLSVIMEGGSTAAESPEPVHRHPPSRAGGPSVRDPALGGPPPLSQGILNDPMEYEGIQDALTPLQLAHRRAVADQLRGPTVETEPRSGMRNTRDDVSIQSSTTRTSAPRRRPNPKMPERLAASRDVEALEKQAEMYAAFGTGQQFPSFDSGSSPEDVAVATHTPEFRKGHRRAMSSGTTVPEITIQPPSRPSSNGSKVSALTGSRMSPQHRPVPIAAPGSPSHRHSLQGPPRSSSRGPQPQTPGQVPMNVGAPSSGEFEFPPGFVPTQGPREIMETYSAGISTKTPGVHMGGLPPRTPMMGAYSVPSAAGPSNIPARTPGGVPLPLSTGTTTWGLPDNASSAPRGTARSAYDDLPRVAATPYEPAAVPPDFRYPASFTGTPSRMPLPESVAGTPWAWGGGALGAGATPGAPMPAPLVDRPMSLYAGDGGANKKVSAASLSSSYKKFEPNAYVDPAYLASNSADARDERPSARSSSRAASVRSVNTQKSGRRSSYAASVETVTDEDGPSQTPEL